MLPLPLLLPPTTTTSCFWWIFVIRVFAAPKSSTGETNKQLKSIKAVSLLSPLFCCRAESPSKTRKLTPKWNFYLGCLMFSFFFCPVQSCFCFRPQKKYALAVISRWWFQLLLSHRGPETDLLHFCIVVRTRENSIILLFYYATMHSGFFLFQTLVVPRFFLLVVPSRMNCQSKRSVWLCVCSVLFAGGSFFVFAP